MIFSVQLLTFDYVLLTLAAGGGVVGMFIGFSGAVATLAGALAAFFASTWIWGESAQLVSGMWLRVIVSAVATLVVFGLVRLLISKFVKFMVAQPADALLGALISAATFAAIGFAGGWLIEFLNFATARSALVEEVLSLVG